MHNGTNRRRTNKLTQVVLASPSTKHFKSGRYFTLCHLYLYSSITTGTLIPFSMVSLEVRDDIQKLCRFDENIFYFFKQLEKMLLHTPTRLPIS